jgi:hypothetical protein
LSSRDLAFLPALALAVVFLSGQAAAGEVQLIPFAEVLEQYNSNVFMTQGIARSAAITTLSPGIALARKNERIDASLSSGLNWSRYDDDVRLDYLDQSHKGALHYGLTERLGISAGAEYTRDSRPDRDLRTTGLVSLEVPTIVSRRRQAYSVGGDVRLSEPTRASLSGSFNKDVYSDPRFIDSETHGATLGVEHDMRRLAENTKGRASFNYTEYRFPAGKEKNHSASVGLSRALNETWSVDADAGGRFTRTQVDSHGWIGRLSLTYGGELSSGNLAYVRDVSTASGRAGTTQRDAFALTLARDFTDKLSGNLYAAYYKNTTDQNRLSSLPLDETTLEVNPGILYRFTKDVSLVASYSYARVRSEQPPAEAVTVERNVVAVRFSARHDLFE